jgi:hypothetical protein
MSEKLNKSSDDSPPEYSPDVNTANGSIYIKPQGRKPHDPDVTFEEYYYYAQKTREEEKTIELPPSTKWREVLLRKKAETPHDISDGEPGAHPSQHLTAANFANRENRLEISDEEWTNASRTLRTASWGACK